VSWKRKGQPILVRATLRPEADAGEQCIGALEESNAALREVLRPQPLVRALVSGAELRTMDRRSREDPGRAGAGFGRPGCSIKPF